MARLNIFVLCLAVTIQVSAGNIGCLFSGNLCDYNEQWCYDDFLFGHCLSLTGDLGQDFYRYDLGVSDLRLVEQELKYLDVWGYGWTHPYTQCVVRALLRSLRFNMDYSRNMCESWKESGGAVSPEGDRPVEPHVIEMDPSEMAFVKFQPSTDNAHPDFADEVYYPPVMDQPMESNEVEFDPRGSMDYNYLSKKSINLSPSPHSHHSTHLLPPSGIFTPLYNTPDKFRVGLETKAKARPSFSENLFQEYNTPDRFREGTEVKDIMEMEEFLKQSSLRQEPSFNQDYNTPERFREGLETRDKQDEILQVNQENNGIPPVTVDHTDPGQQKQLPSPPQRLSPKLGRLAGLLYAPQDGRVGATGYTEGGLVRLPEDSDGGLPPESKERREETDLDDGLDALLMGFKRPERLDVKKPGPLFTALNLAEQHKQQREEEFAKLSSQPATVSGPQSEPVSVADVFKEAENVQSPMPEKKELRPPDLEHSSQYDVVDTTYAYIGFKNSVKSWQEGKKIIHAVAQLLGLPSSTLTQERVDRNEVTFKVLPNPQGMNASEVAKKIGGIKDALKRRTGVEVTSAGIGDKTKLPTVLSLGIEKDDGIFTALFVMLGILGLFSIGTLAFIEIKRHTKSKQKLQNLAAPDTEASKDYQELCRARMATKASQEKPDPIGARIASLSRESEGSNNSPSSRSSTSSWSEEPALTNMDISTGHMVLSYMEDHLKNKDRLDQEWVALCSYEAEPCATVHALKPDNIKKNRYNDVLPYDHSRVVLNDLANISGADYINASTITDHDPRNPAYIATQGPLPHTAADFWQLVWEQGSVVMVMLTRLTENGNAMCHRYWPEEGSELYHIYEVHLVSEHIWCDDYLVRSFYLKNLKTGETRTVTQFHFLSWPDNGVPHTTKALLEFRRKVNKSYRGRSCPIVVHCSDGVGRTGTYCVIDMVLNRMAKGAKEIDIAATLEHIRDQRANMVKTKQQFEFVLTAVAEEVHAILKALPTQPPPTVAQPPTPVAPTASH